MSGHGKDPYSHGCGLNQSYYQDHPLQSKQKRHSGKHKTSYGTQQYGHQHDYSQGGPWGQGPPPSGDPTNPFGYTRDPADPNNPKEGERGFMGALAGGVGGGMLGHSRHHAIIGALAGAFLGSKAEDMFRNRLGHHHKPPHHHHHHHHHPPHHLHHLTHPHLPHLPHHPHHPHHHRP